MQYALHDRYRRSQDDASYALGMDEERIDMGDVKKWKERQYRNSCLHEAAHSVVRQLVSGDLAETGVSKNGTSFSYPFERERFDRMSRETLAETAVIVHAGIVAEFEMCRPIGDPEVPIEDDRRQWEGAQRFGGFTDEEMDGFRDRAESLVRDHEKIIRMVARELDMKTKLSGERVSQIIECGGGSPVPARETT